MKSENRVTVSSGSIGRVARPRATSSSCTRMLQRAAQATPARKQSETGQKAPGQAGVPRTDWVLRVGGSTWIRARTITEPWLVYFTPFDTRFARIWSNHNSG
jgi:hypothetical protein